MLWVVSEELKYKITGLNLDGLEKETVFDFESVNKETVLDGVGVSESREKITLEF